MREIKFRAWDAINKEMVYQEINGLESVFNHDILRKYENVMQSTGVNEWISQEPTKRLIYENDIVILHEDIVGTDIPAFFMGVVKFIEGGFYVDNEKDKKAFSVWSETAQWEILGNTFERPELLRMIDLGIVPQDIIDTMPDPVH